jgi:CHAT domain-containing protein/Flp pilus assembly protein TadD
MAAMKKAFEARENSRPKPRVWLLIVIISLAVAALTVAWLLITRPRGSRVERGTNGLIEAFSKRRLIEPRLSGGFKCGEYKPGDQEPLASDSGLDQPKDLILDAVANGEPGANLAYARLLLSEGKKESDPAYYLRLALGGEPENAEAHNDLGVCLIQQAKLEDAIDEFEVAMKNKPDMPEALFNRAFCYKQLMLSAPARDDLNHAAQSERDADWRKEIARRLDELPSEPEQEKAALDPVAEFDAAFTANQFDEATKIADQNSESLRVHAVWDVAIRHLERAAAGDNAGAERALSELDLIGTVLIKKMEDSLAADIAKYLRGLADDSERTAELSLIKEYVDTARGTDSGARRIPIFERLEKRFHDRGNYIFETLSAFKIADHYYDAKRFSESISKLNQILSATESRAWPYDRARYLNEFALETSRFGQDSLAIKYFQQAVSLCGESPGLESRILQYMSVPHAHLGNLDAALGCLRDSTSLIRQNAGQAGRLQNLAYNYSQIAGVYSRRNQHRLALLYAEQALTYSDQGMFHDYGAEFSSFIAVENARLDQLDTSESSLRRAFEYLDRIGPGLTRDRTETRVLLDSAEVASRAGDGNRALEYCSKAETLAASDKGNTLLAIDLLRARASAYASAGRNDKARSILVNAVSSIENYRANLADSDQRSHFLDASHLVFDRLISIDVDALNLSDEAFEMSERARARALLEEISYGAEDKPRVASPVSVPPLSLLEVKSSLPGELIVLEYSVTAGGTYLFLVSSSGLKLAKSTATTETLDRLTREYLAALRSTRPIEEVNNIARELYDYLIRPVEHDIGVNMQVCIVPDKSLHFLPFAGLVDGAGQYLVETRRLSYAPSASVLIRCIKEDERSSVGDRERILAVGNPDFNPSLFPNLPSLIDAENEATQSAKFYDPSSSVTLLGAQATEPKVRAAIKECEVAHLALHCLVSESSPWLAALVLAGQSPSDSARVSGQDAVGRGGTNSESIKPPGPQRSGALGNAIPQQHEADPNDGLLYFNELYGMTLPRTKLVVLSACQSGLGQYYRGEGMVSLVRPLLAAGVPTVVVSLWPVDSQPTSELMIEFHKLRKESGLRAADALRRAQLDLARSHMHPYYWAPFIVVGSGSSPNRTAR